MRARGRGQCWVGDVFSTQRCGAEAAAQQAGRGGHLGGKRKNGKGVEDRKEGTMEEIEEQRTLYTRAKRREEAFPDRVRLNPKRQRNGTDSTHVINY
jgi:GTP cyclohydrolase II